MQKSTDPDFLTGLFSGMYRIRCFEEQGVALYRQGQIRGYFHPYWGQEAVAVGVCRALNEGDCITSTHRGHGHSIAKGADLTRMFAELLGRKSGYCRGLGGSMHIADLAGGNLGANGIVGSGMPIAAGAAMGFSMAGNGCLSVAFVSDGGTHIGSFSEAVNLAGVWKLPLLIVIENNQFAVSTPISSSSREVNLYKRGSGYGIEGFRVDGNNVLEVYEKAAELTAQIRSGEGPLILECLTYRKSGHHINDPGDYMPEDQVNYYAAHDPLMQGESFLRDMAGMDDLQIEDLKAGIRKEIKQAVKEAMASPELTAEEFYKIVEEYE